MCQALESAGPSKFLLFPLNRELLANYTIFSRYAVPYAFSPLVCMLLRLETSSLGKICVLVLLLSTSSVELEEDQCM